MKHRVLYAAHPAVHEHLDAWTDDSYSCTLRDWRSSVPALAAFFGAPEAGPYLTLYRGLPPASYERFPHLELSSWTASEAEAAAFGPEVLVERIAFSRVLAVITIPEFTGFIEFIVATRGGAIRYPVEGRFASKARHGVK